MYNSQVQLICPVLIYTTRASFKSLIAVFLHQNPRTCGTISVNLDIGSTGARGGGDDLAWGKAKGCLLPKMFSLLLLKVQAVFKGFFWLTQNVPYVMYIICLARGFRFFATASDTLWVWTLALRVYKYCIWQDEASVPSHSLKKYRPWTFWRYVSVCCVYVCELCNKQATCCERFPHLLL